MPSTEKVVIQITESLCRKNECPPSEVHMTGIQIKSVYEAAAKEDGARLVERLRPRGIKKEGSIAHGRMVQESSVQRRSASLVQPRSHQMEGIPTKVPS